MSEWQPWDTWIVLTGITAAMSCALPGVWLVLRRQSLMGDALSHTALPGVVLAFLFAQKLQQAGWAPPGTIELVEPTLLVVGAMLIGVLTAVLAEVIQKLGQVEASAALGVVFTSFFALGLLLVRLKADDVHIDPDCVLFGQLELVVWDRVPIGPWSIPRAMLINGILLLVNLGLTVLCFKELRIAAFDPELATTMGVNARLLHYALMAVTAATLVAAFTTVGSILVVGLLVVPAAAATLLTERLRPLILLTLGLAALSAVLGHVLAKLLPALIFNPLGFTSVRDAGTSGMMAAAAGGLFLLVFLASPRQGLLGKLLHRLRLSLGIAGDDLLGVMYRQEEEAGRTAAEELTLSPLWQWLAPLHLRWQGWAVYSRGALQLTQSGRMRAGRIVRAHRLWESYMQKHFELPDDHLHATAHLVEHFLDEDLQRRLFDELNAPESDPHGRSIPQPPESQ